MLWMIAAILSAVFAGVTSILAKCGIKKTDSDLATAIRTVVVLIFSFSYFVFKEKLSKKSFLGLCLMVAGTLLMAFFK